VDSNNKIFDLQSHLFTRDLSSKICPMPVAIAEKNPAPLSPLFEIKSYHYRAAVLKMKGDPAAVPQAVTGLYGPDAGSAGSQN
jgi:hypothetical protein